MNSFNSIACSMVFDYRTSLIDYAGSSLTVYNEKKHVFFKKTVISRCDDLSLY